MCHKHSKSRKGKIIFTKEIAFKIVHVDSARIGDRREPFTKPSDCLQKLSWSESVVYDRYVCTCKRITTLVFIKME